MEASLTSALADAHRCPADSIAVVVLTHNRVHLLRKCVENVLLADVRQDARDRDLEQRLDRRDGRVPRVARRSADPRRPQREEHRTERLRPRFRADVVAPYLVELDDDVVDAPPHWDATLLDAFVGCRTSASWPPTSRTTRTTCASHYRHRIRPHEYTPVEENGVRLLSGPAGGGCAMTSRELNERVGGFRQHTKEVFWLEDAGLHRGHRARWATGRGARRSQGPPHGRRRTTVRRRGRRRSSGQRYWKKRARRERSSGWSSGSRSSAVSTRASAGSSRPPERRLPWPPPTPASPSSS